MEAEPARNLDKCLVRYHLVDNLENVNPNAHPIEIPTPTQSPMFSVAAPITAPTHTPIADPTAIALLVFFSLSLIYLSIC